MVKTVLLIQLPLPRLNYGRQTGNVPLAGACLKQAGAGLADVELVPESMAAYLADAALLEHIGCQQPEVIGFTVYSWNIRRCLYFARRLKQMYRPKIIFGGPEVTADNALVQSPDVDVCVYGEGENAFQRLLQPPGLKPRARPAGAELFSTSPSPYLNGWLEPEIENLVLLETQRGCPHRCGYCYYHKSRQGLCFADRGVVLEAVRWAWQRKVKELYLLDPCLNARPDLKELLAAIAAVNHDGRLALISEIRAESIDADLADRLAAAGFTWLEIGLQTVTPKALKIMKRPTDLDAFRKGTTLLKQRGIQASIDLIVGLPGDTLEGFDRSAAFVADHHLDEDVQVFPLSILPGTDFRRRRAELGIAHDPEPPYHIIQHPGFTSQQIMLAVDHAETRFDAAFYVMPDLDLAYKKPRGADPSHWVRRGSDVYLARLALIRPRPADEIAGLARRLTQPYQLMIWPDAGDVAPVVRILTAVNPFTPAELVFFEPEVLPETDRLLAAARLHRPHYLDGDQRFLYPQPGNRALLFTLVSADRTPRYTGPMQRQVLWWQGPDLPQAGDLDRAEVLDGVLIDTAHGQSTVAAWQNRQAGRAKDRVAVSFAQPALQQRWLQLTMGDEYDLGAFSWVA
jgi:hypothetical protein